MQCAPLLVALVLAAGCSFSPPDAAGEFACTDGKPECPPGTMCIDGRCTVAADAALPPTGFAFRQRLTFDNRDRGTVADAPVLVPLGPEVFDYGAALADGADLRFTDPDLTPLPHEIESWNPAGRSPVWVKVPEVTGDSDRDYIWLYYGNPSPPAPATGDVWSAYQAVFHLGASTRDSSPLMLEGNANGTQVVAGQVGEGREFDGVSDHIVVGPEPPLLRGVAGMSLEAWVMRSVPGGDGDQVVVAVSAHEGDFSRAQIKLDTTGAVRAVFRTQDVVATSAVLTLDQPLPTNEWTWVVATADLTEGQIRIALDGGETTSSTPADNLDDTSASTSPDQALISIDETGIEWFSGQLDEIRIAGSVPSTDWMAVQYASMTGALIQFERPEAL